jgi:hypothetical protein
VLVGKNESGKSAVLRALSKMKPSDGADYNGLREFPRRRYTDEIAEADWPVASVRQQLTEAEREELTEVAPQLEAVELVEVTRWADVSRTFRWVGSRFSAGQDGRFEVLVAEECGDLAYSVGYETARLSIDCCSPKPWRLRVTHVYRREDGQWRLVHRHGDIAPPGR